MKKLKQQWNLLISRQNITNNISFEFEDYIVNNPFYNNETMEELSIEEAIEIYGKENVEQFIVSIIEEQSNKHGGRTL